MLKLLSAVRAKFGKLLTIVAWSAAAAAVAAFADNVASTGVGGENSAALAIIAVLAVQLQAYIKAQLDKAKGSGDTSGTSGS